MEQSAAIVLILVCVVIAVAAIVVSLVANWRIWSQAGYNGALSLLLLIPLVGVIVYLVFAFSEWPVTKRIRSLEGGGGGMPPS